MPPAPEAAPPSAHCVRVAHGSFYLARELCDRYLPAITCLATIVRDGQVFLMPLLGPAAGGSLMKFRNARGDRVVHADEFLRSLGIGVDAPEQWVEVRWVTDMAALVLEGLIPISAVAPDVDGGGAN